MCIFQDLPIRYLPYRVKELYIQQENLDLLSKRQRKIYCLQGAIIFTELHKRLQVRWKKYFICGKREVLMRSFSQNQNTQEVLISFLRFFSFNLLCLFLNLRDLCVGVCDRDWIKS